MIESDITSTLGTMLTLRPHAAHLSKPRPRIDSLSLMQHAG